MSLLNCFINFLKTFICVKKNVIIFMKAQKYLFIKVYWSYCSWPQLTRSSLAYSMYCCTRPMVAGQGWGTPRWRWEGRHTARSNTWLPYWCRAKTWTPRLVQDQTSEYGNNSFCTIKLDCANNYSIPQLMQQKYDSIVKS